MGRKESVRTPAGNDLTGSCPLLRAAELHTVNEEGKGGKIDGLKPEILGERKEVLTFAESFFLFLITLLFGHLLSQQCYSFTCVTGTHRCFDSVSS